MDEPGGVPLIFRPFPKVVLKLVFHPAEEDFPAEFRLLFDSTATAFMDFEALSIMAGAFVDVLCQPATA